MRTRRLFSGEFKAKVALEAIQGHQTVAEHGHDNIRPDELARRIVHLAMEGERDPVQLHDGALLALIPATTWREIR